MKFPFLILLLLIVQQGVWAQCNSGAYTVSGNGMISSSCTITGDLTLLNGSTLNVDLTGASADTFVVRGNILLQGNAVLWIHSSPGSANDQFIVSNTVSNQRTITMKDSSHLVLENMEFRTQEGNLSGAASIYMNLYALDNSIFYVNKSRLDKSTAWLLCNLQNKSTLQGFEPDGVPTEIYLQDTAQMALHGPNTKTGIWLNFQSITGALILPDQTQPYSWQIGRGAGGLNTTWYLEVDTAQPGLGVQIMPSAKITINGTGSASKEVTVALLFANSTDTVKNLGVGIQNSTIANGPNGHVTLNNVNLGPIAWQLYALMNEHLFVKNSIVNEIGIAGPSTVVVDSSLLQLAVLASVGQGGSAMTVNNSGIWSQAITAANSSTITLNNCAVTGSAFSTSDAQSHITVNGGCFFANPAGCTENTMVNMTTGQPHCNPFIPPGFPQNLSPSTVTFNGVNNNCTSGINEAENSEWVNIFPNPATDIIQVNLQNSNQNFSVEIYSTLGQLLLKVYNKTLADISDLASGIYLIKIEQQGKTQSLKIVKQ